MKGFHFAYFPVVGRNNILVKIKKMAKEKKRKRWKNKEALRAAKAIRKQNVRWTLKTVLLKVSDFSSNSFCWKVHFAIVVVYLKTRHFEENRDTIYRQQVKKFVIYELSFELFSSRTNDVPSRSFLRYLAFSVFPTNGVC